MHLGGTLFLPAQGRTPRVPVKAAKGSHAKRSQASSFIGMRSKQASYRGGSCGYLCIALGSGGTFALGSGGTICLSPVDKNHLSVPLNLYPQFKDKGPDPVSYTHLTLPTIQL